VFPVPLKAAVSELSKILPGIFHMHLSRI
jgi:hypothetical protein